VLTVLVNVMSVPQLLDVLLAEMDTDMLVLLVKNVPMKMKTS